MKKSGNVDGNVVKPQTHFGNYIFKAEKNISYRERITTFTWGEIGKICRSR
jgi:hypothetical protein